MDEQSDKKITTNFIAVLIGAESIVLLVVSISILGLLNYLNILPLSQNYPQFFGFLPHQKTLGTQPISGSLSTQVVDNPTIEVSSGVGGYVLELQNKDNLIELLKDWGIYGLPVLQRGTPGVTHIRKLQVKLVDDELPLDKIKTLNGPVYLSSNVTPQANNTILVEIQVGKDILKDRTDEAGGFLQSQFLRTMYFQQASINTPKKSFKLLEQEVIEKLQQLNKEDKNYFKINKK